MSHLQVTGASSIRHKANYKNHLMREEKKEFSCGIDVWKKMDEARLPTMVYGGNSMIVLLVSMS